MKALVTTPARLRRDMHVVAIASSLALLPACVSSGRYDAAIDRITHDRGRIVALNQRVATCERESTTAEARRKAEVAGLRVALDDETALAQELRVQLLARGQDVEQLAVQRGSLAAALAATKARLELARRAQAAAEERAATFHDLALKLKGMIDAGELQVLVRDGRLMIALPNDVLFDSGQVDIKPRGRESLKQVAWALRTMGDRHFQVAGHTDTVPIATARFPSNWELSTTRALEVTRFLMGQGVRSEQLSAAGYGEFDPVATNENASGRTKNRRIEITVMPNIDEMVAIPDR